jgi:hypothetical protein
MEQTLKTRSLSKAIGLGVALLTANSSTYAYELYADEDTKVTGNFLAVYGMFNSRKNYDGTTGGSSWREGFIKYGLSVDQTLGSAGSVYGTANLVSSGTWGTVMRRVLRMAPSAPRNSTKPLQDGVRANSFQSWARTA